MAASPAQANVPPAKTINQPIRMVSNSASTGSIAFTLSYSGTAPQSTAVARSTGSVTLAGGKRYRVVHCVSTHIFSRVPANDCKEMVQDRRTATGSASFTIPAASVNVARPAQGASGQRPWAYAIAEVQAWDAAKQAWAQPMSTSWPAGAGLSTTAAAVIAQNETSASLPGPEGVPIDPSASPVPTGGINTGRPDSVCRGETMAAKGPAPSDVSTTALGTMPAYYEVGQPTGAFAGQPPKGTLLFIHGGGWFTVGPGAVATARSDVDRWRSKGWRTVSFTYRPCGGALADVLAFYDRTKATYGDPTPVCAMGGSAGGTLALLLAAWRPLDCAVSQGGFADLRALHDQRAYSPVPGQTGQSLGPRQVQNWAVAAFGEENLNWYSPAWYTGLRGRVLMANTERDMYSPFAQATEFAALQQSRDPERVVDTYQLAFGATPFAHGNVSVGTFAEYVSREEALVAPLLGD